MRVYLDSTVLIAAATGREPGAKAAFDLINGGSMRFVASAFVALESYPQAIHNRRQQEIDFYDEYFRGLDGFVETNESLVQAALSECAEIPGLSPIDALHLAAAHRGRCEAVITLEKPSKPWFRSKLVAVRRLE